MPCIYTINESLGARSIFVPAFPFIEEVSRCPNAQAFLRKSNISFIIKMTIAKVEWN